MFKYLKKISGTIKISEWRSQGISNEIISKPDDVLAPTVDPLGRDTHLKFNGSCLRTTEQYLIYPELTELNIYIVYSLSSDLNNFDFASENCLFDAIRLTKNADIDKYKYLGVWYWI